MPSICCRNHRHFSSLRPSATLHLILHEFVSPGCKPHEPHQLLGTAAARLYNLPQFGPTHSPGGHELCFVNDTPSFEHSRHLPWWLFLPLLNRSARKSLITS